MLIPEPAPLITAITPSSGPTSGGTLVTITGQNFQPGGWVRFGPSFGYSLTFVSPTELTVMTPYSSVAGPVTVTLNNPDGQSVELAMGYQYVSAPPVLTSFNPSSGPVTGGTMVVISGSGFQYGTQVFFGDTPAVNVTYANMYTLTCESPEAAGPGEVWLKVVNPDGQMSQLPFVYEEVLTDPSDGSDPSDTPDSSDGSDSSDTSDGSDTQDSSDTSEPSDDSSDSAAPDGDDASGNESGSGSGEESSDGD